MTSATFDTVFDTTKPIFILEVINTISEAAKAQINRLQEAFKKRSQRMQEMASTLSKLGKAGKLNRNSTAQSEAYDNARPVSEIASILAQSQQRKTDFNGKGGGGSRSL